MGRWFEAGPVQKGHSAMMRRHLGLVRAFSAAGLMAGMMGMGALATAQTPTTRSTAAEPTSRPVDVATETVDLLKASQAGDLAVVARGQGQDHVRLSIQNTSKRRLNVIIPPGLVAANLVGQGAGGAGGRGGMQNMGLGSISNRDGAFGDFQAAPRVGLRSVAAVDDRPTHGLAVPVGETLDLSVPAVCLDFGKPAPTGRVKLSLMDVSDFTDDLRVRRALRALATLGTSQGVAQAVMWNLRDDLSFEAMFQQTGKYLNASEVVLAKSFIEALDASSEGDLVDAGTISRDRILVRLRGEGKLAPEASRIASQLEGVRIMGLPVRLVTDNAAPAAGSPSLFLDVLLTEGKVGETRGKVLVGGQTLDQGFAPLGRLEFRENSSASVIDADALAKTLGQTVASAFVTVKTAKKTTTSTTVRVTNRLPFTISSLVLRAGSSAGSPPVSFDALGVGPQRSMLLPVQAAGASLVDRVELNGL